MLAHGVVKVVQYQGGGGKVTEGLLAIFIGGYPMFNSNVTSFIANLYYIASYSFIVCYVQLVLVWQNCPCALPAICSSCNGTRNKC